MVIASPPCERCGGIATCTRLESHVLRADICGTCRTVDEFRAVATEEYLNAEYELERLLANRHGLRSDGSPGPRQWPSATFTWTGSSAGR